MKIIHLVLGRANPNRMNGVNRVAHNLATSQTSHEMDVAIWGITSSAFSKDDEIERDYKTKWFLPSKIPFIIPKELKKAISQQSNTVFHLHGGFIPVFYSISKFMQKNNIKHFITPHGTYTDGAMKGNGLVKNIYFHLLEKKLISRVKSVQCLGHCEASDLKKRNIYPNISIIPNGQNWDELAFNGEVKTTNEFIIGYCGRLSKWQKGMDILMTAFSIYKNNLNGTGKLHLVGDGPYKEKMIKTSKKLAISNDVVFHGSQYGQAKIALLKNMKVFIHTSRNEGLPTAVIEALALGIPCIVSVMTSLDRYVEEYNAGWALPDLNPKKVAIIMKKAEKSFNQENLTEISKNAVNLAQTAFDWQRIAKQTLDMYAK